MTLITDDMKTDWYPPEVKPVHYGVYEVETINGTLNVYYCHYGANGWSYCSLHVEGAAGMVWAGTVRERSWRGLKAPHDGETS